MSEAKLGWQRVHGPAGAVAMSLHRAGRTWPKWHVWHTRELERKMWADWCTKHEQQQLWPAPFLDPLLRLTHAKHTDEWNQKHTGALRGVVTGGAITQTTLAEWYPLQVSDELCQLCRQDYGTPMHRFHLCPHTKAWRNNNYQRQWQHTAECASANLQVGVESSHVWHTGLTAVPWAQWSFTPVPDTDDNHSCYTGQVYGDGSAKGAGEYAMCG